MKVIVKCSDSNKTVVREASDIVAEHFNSLREKEQLFFFDLFLEIGSGNVTSVAYQTDLGKKFLIFE